MSFRKTLEEKFLAKAKKKPWIRRAVGSSDFRSNQAPVLPMETSSQFYMGFHETFISPIIKNVHIMCFYTWYIYIMHDKQKTIYSSEDIVMRRRLRFTESLGWVTEDGSAPEEQVLASPLPWSSLAAAVEGR